MPNKNILMLLAMIWFTVLTVWTVVTLSNNHTVTVQGIPIQPTISSPQQQQFTTVQIDKDTVWVIDNSSDMLKVITHDKYGYHLTQERMVIQDNY